ncbi:hypothetical protein ABEB36_000375 [Hypothenemus hampei]|uniref:Uncharacterized protein n=1 Tax=Hypothenemus hampei TaxID=57062 RepID=A0ABD1FB11_HYPHA
MAFLHLVSFRAIFGPIKLIKYSKSVGDILTSYCEDQYKSVNIKEKERRSKINLVSFNEVQLAKTYNDSLPIAKKKHSDLMYLVSTNAIKKSYSYFYSSLKVSSENGSS